ncbi:MAG: hypothetical protein Q4D79_14540 [Propionibacteriaceae bacterium]|nr:hypothetical protein [Propionibacteriaceae bacterium]
MTAKQTPGAVGELLLGDPMAVADSLPYRSAAKRHPNTQNQARMDGR